MYIVRHRLTSTSLRPVTSDLTVQVSQLTPIVIIKDKSQEVSPHDDHQVTSQLPVDLRGIQL